MNAEANVETRGFETEAKQLLHLMIHSLYSNKEIFLRELISNASDAADKLRFEALANGDLYEGDAELKIKLSVDKEAKTVAIIDNGIGMNRPEVIEHLGTIAKSGTAQFLSKLSGDEKKDSQLIGQFGVGFYSAFIVADKVIVESRRAGDEASEGVRWVSEGEAEYTVEGIEKSERGTTITLFLKDGEEDFAEDWRLRSIVKKYSDHVSLPIVMDKVTTVEPEEEGGEATETIEEETINKATALWTRSRSDISEDEYKEFYKHISNDFSDPLTWSHNRVEGKLDYTSLLYLPGKAPMDMQYRDSARGLKLYVQRTFIMDDAEQFLPMYLRFIKGIVDSNDLSLNVSREILQKDPHIDTMKSALTKRVLDMLDKMAKKEPEQYAVVWKEYGEVLKEGPAEDFSNKEKISKLLRFSTTHTGSDAQDQSLDAYIERMKEGQDKIYYVVADNHVTAKNSPHLEVFRKKGIEVILLSDRVDDWLVGHLMTYNEKQFEDVAKGELDLGSVETEEEKKAQEEAEQKLEGLTTRMKDVLGDKVQEVRITHRLTESPACLVVGKDELGAQMRRLLESAGQNVPSNNPTIELNPEHLLITKLDQEPDEDRFADLANIVFDQAQLAEGGQLEDPASFVQRLNKFLIEMAQ